MSFKNTVLKKWRITVTYSPKQPVSFEEAIKPNRMYRIIKDYELVVTKALSRRKYESENNYRV